ncbi:hypothetical protein [Chitinophaga sancti]|uniref:Phage protein D n=1 Tax=Chitinophaga sancti TaxID=1004 RepID=A0A1K1LPQ8_9BACT|nr:hypothetical protein [Chitinophaga sancti]WQD64948.1 hypothetical protein U0033_11135 [Chitinophaga sancti]WQG89428.1 hypothetical protein SR876_31335 [Chitinophaga sancti]SFW12866.1 hypothetical protein SAMN05661012_00113 [Chitinophaga sancti]
MFVLQCEIKIGSYTFYSVKEVKIKRSLHSYTDTASITIPASAVLRYTGQFPTKSVVSSAAQFAEGDKVEIWLGYDDKRELEFEGFVARINAATPCVIECEGYSWQLKQKGILENQKATSLKKLLSTITDGTDIKVSTEVSDLDLHQAYFDGKSGTDILDWFKKDLSMNVYFEGRWLYAGFDHIEHPQAGDYVRGRKTSDILNYKKIKENAWYELGFTVIKDSELKFRKANDAHVLVKAIYIDTKNKAHIQEAGDKNGVETLLQISNFQDDAALKKAAENKLKTLKYDGYEGKLEAFLQPFAFPGCKAEISDTKYPVRNGTYRIESTEVTFNASGGRRKAEIGLKI